jgi:hypothetical protein
MKTKIIKNKIIPFMEVLLLKSKIHKSAQNTLTIIMSHKYYFNNQKYIKINKNYHNKNYKSSSKNNTQNNS